MTNYQVVTFILRNFAAKCGVVKKNMYICHITNKNTQQYEITKHYK